MPGHYVTGAPSQVIFPIALYLQLTLTKIFHEYPFNSCMVLIPGNDDHPYIHNLIR